MEAESEIAKWYKGKAVLITGAMGFMGKVLVEKLLRSCPDLGPMYVFVRGKKETLPGDRVEKLMSSSAFDKIRATGMYRRNRVIPIPGDISLPGLGISAEHRQLLQETVSVVFHLAATVRFDEPLKIAVAINLEGTRALMQLCLGMTKLSAIVHVSTAYTNYKQSVIEERVYAPPADPDTIAHCVANMDDDLLGIITPALLGDGPNTYAFTKALAEHIVAGYSTEMPIVVVRPSIVLASWREPSPGWIDNFNGPTAFVVGAGKGWLTSIYGQDQLVADLIPVDVCINVFIAAAWEIGTRDSHTSTPRLHVYNCVSRPSKFIAWNEFLEIIDKCMKVYPFSDFLSSPSVRMTDSYVKYALAYLEHALPAALADIVVGFSGGIPRYRCYQRRLMNRGRLARFFVTRGYEFKTDNVEALWRRLNPEDQMIFNIDMKNINWEEYLTAYFLGIRRHLMNEKDDTIHTARQRLTRRVQLTKSITIGMLVIVGICSYSLFSKQLPL